MRLAAGALVVLAVVSSTTPDLASDGLSAPDLPGSVRESAPPDSSVPTPGADAVTFPRLLEWKPPARSDFAGDTLAHFIICQVKVDASGRPDTVRALGCEGNKEALCDLVIRALRSATFRPATKGNRPVASTCDFGVTFPAGARSIAVAGIPVIGFWADSLCAYRGRIYGSAELALESRPIVTRRERAAYPEQARGYPAVARVKLRAVVDPDGELCFVLCDSAVPPDLGFVEAAVAAAYGYRYQPGVLKGHRQAVWVEIDFRWDPRE